jgi:hypothetical protein
MHPPRVRNLPRRFILLLLGLLPVLAIRATPSTPPVLTATAEWNSNLTNSNRDSDVIGALRLRAELEAFSWRVALGHDDALVVGAGARADVCPRFDGLDQFALGPDLAWRHKFGLGALAPVFSVEAGADAVAARESDRAGFAGRARVAWSQRFDDAMQLVLSYEWSRHDARETVYDRTGREAAAELRYALDERWQVSAGATWREGDVLSYATPPRPDLVALARVRTTVDTFGSPRVAYSLSARTLGGSLAFTRSLGERSALTLRYEGRDTERSALRYVNHLVSTAISHQF